MGLTKVSTPAIKDEAITLAKLLHGDSNNNGKFLRANNGADPTFETVSTDLVADTTPQLGGNLDTNNYDVTFQGLNNYDLVWDYSEADLTFSDHAKLRIGTGNDLTIYHDGSNSYIEESGSGNLYIFSQNLRIENANGTKSYIEANNGGATELYWDGTKKLETTNNGAKIESATVNLEIYSSTDDADATLTLIGKTGSGGVGQAGRVEIVAESTANNSGASSMHLRTRKSNNTVTTAITIDKDQDVTLPIDAQKLRFGASQDLQIYHDGSHSYIKDNGTGNLRIQSNATIQLGDPTGGIDYAKFINGGHSEIYGDNVKRFETTSYGTKVSGYQSASSYVGFHVKGTSSDAGFGTNHGSGITSYDVNYYSPIPMFASKTIDHGSSYLAFPAYANGNYIKFTAPVAGLYMLELMASVETHHGGDWCVFGWEVNTTTNDGSSGFANNGRGICAVYERAGGDEGMGCHFSTTIYLNTNDYAVLYQQSTAAVRWKGNEYYVRGHLL